MTGSMQHFGKSNRFGAPAPKPGAIPNFAKPGYTVENFAVMIKFVAKGILPHSQGTFKSGDWDNLRKSGAYGTFRQTEPVWRSGFQSQRSIRSRCTRVFLNAYVVAARECYHIIWRLPIAEDTASILLHQLDPLPARGSLAAGGCVYNILQQNTRTGSRWE